MVSQDRRSMDRGGLSASIIVVLGVLAGRCVVLAAEGAGEAPTIEEMFTVIEQWERGRGKTPPRKNARAEKRQLPRGGLVGHWKLSDGRGRVAADSTERHRAGTLHGGPKWTKGKRGYVLAFDGVDDFVSLPHDPALEKTDRVTFACWFKLAAAFDRTTPTSQILLEKFLDNDNNMILVLAGKDYRRPGDPAGSLLFKVESAHRFHYKWTGRRTWSANRWYHVAAVLDARNVANNKIYVNGAGDTPGNAGGGGSGNLDFRAEVHIGGKSAERAQLQGERYFRGLISDVRLYNRALSAAEIKALAAGRR